MDDLLTLCVTLLAILSLVLLLLLWRALEQRKVLNRRIIDLSETKNLLLAQASHDSLTGLGNRILLADRFFSAVERAKRANKSFAMLMIDLNDFKNVNDSHGHAAGDYVLTVTAERLVAAVRASDTVARVGGDEFVLIMEVFQGAKDLVRIGNKVIETLSDDIALDSGALVSVGASVGFALYPQDGTDIKELLNVADKSMYSCKTSGMMELR